MKLIKCPDCGRLVCVQFPMHHCTSPKHGIELRFGKGRKLKLLSYAIYTNGNCIVGHEHTRAAEKAYGGIKERLEIERKHYPDLQILNANSGQLFRWTDLSRIADVANKTS